MLGSSIDDGFLLDTGMHQYDEGMMFLYWVLVATDSMSSLDILYLL
jgi:hypothetical protein